MRELKERKRRMNEKSISVPAGLRARTALFSFRQTHFHSHELFKSFSFDTLPNYNIHTCASTLPQQQHTGVQNNIFKGRRINDVAHVTVDVFKDTLHH